jgi:hypothetical protein
MESSPAKPGAAWEAAGSWPAGNPKEAAGGGRRPISLTNRSTGVRPICTLLSAAGRVAQSPDQYLVTKRRTGWRNFVPAVS